MILKEAFRYQNYLAELKTDLVMFLRNRDNITQKEYKYLYSSANSDKADESEIVKSEYDINKVVGLIDTIIAEKESITRAISKVKSEISEDIDAELEINKFKSSFIDALEHMNTIKSSESKGTAVDYKFNVNGEQLSYKFPTVTVETINFDRKKTKGMANTLSKQTDDTSNLIDKLNVTVNVDFEPRFNIKDSLEDILNNL